MSYPTTYIAVDCCGDVIPTTKDIRKDQFWSIAFNDIVTVYDVVISGEVFGNRNTCYLELLNLFHYFYFFLECIQDEREIYIVQNGSDTTNTYWNQLYCIDTIKKKLHCKGMKGGTITRILNFYSLLDDEYDVGIGGLIIEGSTDPLYSF